MWGEEIDVVQCNKRSVLEVVQQFPSCGFAIRKHKTPQNKVCTPAKI
jgi:hypothetical protein